MKTISQILSESFTIDVCENFTIDDEIAAIYLRIFKEGGFDKEYGDDDSDYREIEMWHSLSEPEREAIIERSGFTGFVNESGDMLEIYKIVPLDTILGQAQECIDNRVYSNDTIDMSDTHITLSYSKPKIGANGVEYKWFDVEDTDLENNPFIRDGKNVKWKNRIDIANLEWALESAYDDIVYVKNAPAINSFIKFTGCNYYKNGKKMR